jgi:hypothetical protein
MPDLVDNCGLVSEADWLVEIGLRTHGGGNVIGAPRIDILRRPDSHCRSIRPTNR